MIILGISAFHGDSSACLIRDGSLVAAAEEERFRRIKHWAGFPTNSIRYCLQAAGVSLSQVDHIAVNHDPNASLARKFAYAVSRRSGLALLLARMRVRQKRASVRERLRRAFPEGEFTGEIHEVEHHLAHLGSAYFASPHDEAVTVSVDGFGDFASAAWGLGRDNAISIDGRIHFPHSLGIFYEAITQHLGFRSYGDEYKTMGLAAYGKASQLGSMRSLVKLRPDGGFELDLVYFRHHSHTLEHTWEDCEPRFSDLASPALAELLGPARASHEEITALHRDVACSAQAMYEESLFHLLVHLHERYRIDTLAFAGGCAMNSLANGKITTKTPFRNVYIPPAPGDAGGAVGAAFVTWKKVGREQPRAGRFRMDHAYWGPGFEAKMMRDAVESRSRELIQGGYKVRDTGDETELCTITAEALASGKVVGWFQGRMEFGPRALGNRSILCDPRRAESRDALNSIKRRELFRPFGPSVLREAVAQWFEIEGDMPFMSQAIPVRVEKRGRIPAVTHVDGSARLQTVTWESSPLFHRLIAAFAAITGVPMLLNTSFNEREPMVCQPSEALDCCLRAEIDVLVLGSCVVSKPGTSS